MSFKQTTKDSPKAYVAKLNRVAKLRKQSGAALHERVKLLCEVAGDPEYLNKMAYEMQADALSMDQVAEVFNGKYLDDTVAFGFDFETLQTLLRYFPEPDDWERQTLPAMWDAAVAKTATASQEPSRTRRSVKVAEFVAEQKRRQVAEKRANQAEERASESETEVEQLRRENGELRERVAELERENNELRRLATEPMVAVG